MVWGGGQQDAQLNFRGQRIWSAAMQHLLSIGMNNAQQVSFSFPSISCLLLALINLNLHIYNCLIIITKFRLFYLDVLPGVWPPFYIVMSLGSCFPILPKSNASVMLASSLTRNPSFSFSFSTLVLSYHCYYYY